MEKNMTLLVNMHALLSGLLAKHSPSLTFSYVAC